MGMQSDEGKYSRQKPGFESLISFSLASLLLLGVSSTAKSSDRNPKHGGTQTRGSINIIIANKQGLVAVTDSKITADDMSPDYKQKLFVIDDHTICTVAGWYSNLGLKIGSTRYLADAAIPNFVQQFIAMGWVPTSTLDEKVKIISSVLKFALEASADIGVAFGELPPRFRSEVTLSSYDAGRFVIVKFYLVPRTVNSMTTYLSENYQSRSTMGKVVPVVAGDGVLAQRFFDDPERFRNSNVVFQEYAKGIAADGGESLSLETLKKLALALEELTATDDYYRQFVGGPTQVALLRDAKAVVVNQPYAFNRDNDPVPGFFRRYEYESIHDSDEESEIEWPNAGFITNSVFIKVRNQRIDNGFFSHNLIQSCILRYDGSPKFSLDATNTIEDSVLLLGPAVDDKSTAVTDMIRNFPGLKVIDRAGNVITPPASDGSH